MATWDDRVANWQNEKINYQMMMQVGGKAYACPQCWDWPTVYKCSAGNCVVDPTGMGGFTKPDCGGKCTTYKCSGGRCVVDATGRGPYVGDKDCDGDCPALSRLQKTLHHSAPLWETRADDLMDLRAVPSACPLRGAWKVLCDGQIGSPSAYGAIYKVKLPVTSQSTLTPTGNSPTWIVGKCMIVASSNAKEQRLAQAASDLVAGKITAYFPLLIGVATGCPTPLRASHPAAKHARSLGIPLPLVKDIMYSELAQQDLIMWIKSPHTAQEWKRVYYQVFSAIEFMQSYLNIIHNDMHGGNVLLTSSGTALIHDFGLATIIGSGPNMTGRTSSMWVPEDRFKDYRRACGMRYWAGTPELPGGRGGYGGYAAPAEIIDIFDQCTTEMKRAFMFYARPTNDAALACCRRMRELWNPAYAMYRAPKRLALRDNLCSAACDSAGVLDPDTLQCSIDQTQYPGVQCCQSAITTGCACAGSDQCVQPAYPDEPAFTLKLVKTNGSGTLNVGVAWWAGQTILVCLHPDAQPAKFKFVPNDAAGTVYLQIFQTAFGPAQYPPPEQTAPADAPLYIRNGPPNYGGESEGYTYVTTNLANATQFTIIPVDEETGKFQLSVITQRGPNYSTTEYLHSDDAGNSLSLFGSVQWASTFQAVLD